jgi:hypothetical protein
MTTTMPKHIVRVGIQTEYDVEVEGVNSSDEAIAAVRQYYSEAEVAFYGVVHGCYFTGYYEDVTDQTEEDDE